MKTKRWKRVISSIMAVMMCCTAFPGTAYAAKQDMDQMVEGSFTVDGCGKLKITDINGEEYVVETGQTLTLESVPGNTLQTEAIPEDGSLVKRYMVSHANEEVELEENLDILNAESSYRRDITVSDPFTVQVDFENKETERQNEVKEENATEQTIKEEETLEEKQDDIAEESKEKWIDLMALPELGTDIGNQSLGDALGTVEIVDENTPSFLASEGSICTIVKGVEIPYMSWSTHMFTVNSETGSYPAYCMEPHKSSPSGPATVSILENDTIKALLLCAYEGPYPMLSPDALVELGVPLEEAKKSIYCITHACVSYVYCGSLQGVDPGPAQDYVNHIKTVQKWASEHPDIMEQYTAYAAYSGNQQDMCWLEKTGVPKGNISMQKVSSNPTMTEGNGCYSLEGAVYGVYDKDSNLITQMTTNAEGKAVSESIPYGTYWIKEIEAPEGFALNPNWSEAITLNAESAVVTVTDIPQNDPINVVLRKRDADTAEDNSQGSASLQNAEFTVKYYKGYYDSDPKAQGIEAARSWVLKTDEQGICKLLDSYKVSGDDFYKDSNGYETFPLGTVTIQETKAPSGYLIDSQIFVRQIKGEGTIEPVDVYNEVIVSEKVIRGGVSIEKWDFETKNKVPQGSATLAGAEFTITNQSAKAVIVDGKSYEKGKEIMTIKTGEEGIASTKNDVLPYGEYQISETKAPDGYLPAGENLTQNFSIRKNGELVELNTEKTAAQNKVIRGGVKIEKWDYELHEKVPQGSATLEGAEFTITNQSKQPVIVEGVSYPVGAVIMTLVTDQEGVALTKNNILPYGEYEISETKAPVGYLPEGENLTQKFSIRENGKIVELNTEDTAAQNQVKRGDLQLVKAEDGTLHRMAHVKFTITSKTTGESHPFVTDENGYYSTSSSWNPHTQNTNRGEASEDGIWFGTSKPNDEHGALIYDTYTIEEQECEANKGHKLIKFDVVIKRDNVTVDLGTITDDLLPVVSIHTTASVKDTMGNDAYAVDNVTIADEVFYSNLTPGEEYTLKGMLMDKSTGKALLIEGKEITSEKTFTASKETGTISVEFTFDARGLEGKEIVVFEKLYWKEAEIASHEDIEDEDQTILFHNPEIKTTAYDKETGDHYSYAVDQVTIIDKVSYQDLIPGKEYTVKGTLMDKETGETLLIGGKPVTAEKTFIAGKKDGSVELEFTFDASGLKGKETVVFEKLFYEEKEIAVHEDLDDKNQTVKFQNPEIKTTASDKTTGTNEGIAQKEVTIVDKVEYNNLIPGKEYTVKGILMDKETGKPLLIDGKKVTAEKTFTAKSEAGSIELEFTFDGSTLGEKGIVVFEKLFYNGREIAAHEDIEDMGQTVTMHKEKTVTITSKKPGTTTSTSKPVKTGDASQIALYVGLAVLAMAGILVSVILKKRKKPDIKRLPCKKEK
ncbi:VaFE repeat-containing surface-anchored protein [Blautia sp.]|uniref:VaFE repeat-containing surface-anchored protein n=1 Tax=Blautia sp. TaxID=1955243 RepID=UPI00257F2B06|nr:VaFE repeat-containing surface-anchored protein [Blautia sp.]